MCERKNMQVQELRDTYHGVLMILRHFMSKDTYTAHHCQRVSAYSAIIAETLELGGEIIEDIKAAGMLHDIGKLDISRDLLYKAARLTSEEYEEIKKHVSKGIEHARAGRRLAAARDSDYPGAPRQVRRFWVSPDERRRDSD